MENERERPGSVGEPSRGDVCYTRRREIARRGIISPRNNIPRSIYRYRRVRSSLFSCGGSLTNRNEFFLVRLLSSELFMISRSQSSVVERGHYSRSGGRGGRKKKGSPPKRRHGKVSFSLPSWGKSRSNRHLAIAAIRLITSRISRATHTHTQCVHTSYIHTRRCVFRIVLFFVFFFSFSERTCVLRKVSSGGFSIRRTEGARPPRRGLEK